MQNLGTIFVGLFIEGTLEACATCRESAGGDIVGKKFLIDDVDHGRDKRLDVLGAGDEGVDVGYEEQTPVGQHKNPRAT